jgi:uroporphyrinogen III methyltransferase/synthase
MKGMVYLVGAGPGDAGLLTQRGAELIGRADVVVYDALVNADLLRLAPPGAEIIYGGKRAENHPLPQAELNAILIAKAREGRTVVRLKGGDPYIFGRGGEEAWELAQAGIPFEVVPGVSSLSAVPNYGGIPLTHREHGSILTVISGHEDPAKPGGKVDWAQVARTPGTKAILMATPRIGQIAQLLVQHGMDSATPIGLVSWGTTGRQKTLTGTLGTIAETLASSPLSPPTVAVIGGVVDRRAKLNWFERRPLFGQRIVVTRAATQAGKLATQLREHGAEVLELPTIKIEPPTKHDLIVDAIAGLNSYDWLVFTSANGVTAFFDFFFKAFDDLRDLGGARIAAVGPGTAARLKELHLKVDVMPAEALGKKVAKALSDYESMENLRVVLLRAEKANPELPELLAEMGAIVDDIPCYRTVPETEDRNGAAARFRETGADWITFTSASTVENFHARFPLPEILAKFPDLKTASIGPETSKALAALGLKPTLEAREHTIEGLIAAIGKKVKT